MITNRSLAGMAQRLMRCPAAPYFEHAVRSAVEAVCKENELQFQRDSFGNVIVRLQAAAAFIRPLVLAAHMDHPGFEAVAGSRTGELQLRFNGGVPDQFFRSGLRVQLMPGAVRAKTRPSRGAGAGFPRQDDAAARFAAGIRGLGA